MSHLTPPSTVNIQFYSPIPVAEHMLARQPKGSAAEITQQQWCSSSTMYSSITQQKED